MTALFTDYELLLGQYCQTRDGALYIHLTRDVMPALTMSQEEDECASRYRRLHPGQLTPFDEPRNLRYEEWKRTNCWRWYYFDHEEDAKKTLAMRLARDEECRVSRVPTLRQTFRMDATTPADVRPATARWKGYEPPPLPGPLLGIGEGPPSKVSVALQFGSVFALGAGAVGALVAVGRNEDVARGALLGAAIGFGLGLPFGISGWWTA